MRIIIATKNNSKLKEIKEILAQTGLEIISLTDLEKDFKINENGKTFLENARKKSLPVSKVYRGDYVVGEDSGLKVKYLGQEPGIYSKRYSGRGATDAKNNIKLLEKLKGVAESNRGAEFVCCLSLAVAGKEWANFEGNLEGTISSRPQGENGFGYDPVFYLPSLAKTVAQLSEFEKNKISHRAQAFLRFERFLQEFNFTA